MDSLITAAAPARCVVAEAEIALNEAAIPALTAEVENAALSSSTLPPRA